MGWLEGLSAAGTGVTALLGTPEQQRERERRALESGQNLAMRQEQLAETTRQQDLQYEDVDYTPDVNALLVSQGKAPLPLGTLKGPRSGRGALTSGMAQSLFSQPKTPPTLRDTLTQAKVLFPDDNITIPAESETRSVSPSGPTQISPEFPDEIGTPPAVPTTFTRPEVTQALDRPIQPGMVGGLRERSKARAEQAKEKRKREALAGYAEDVENKIPPAKAFRDRGLAEWFTPSQVEFKVEKPEKSAPPVKLTGEGNEVSLYDRDTKTTEIIRPADPQTLADAAADREDKIKARKQAAELRQLQIDVKKASEKADDVEARILAGHPVTQKERESAAAALRAQGKEMIEKSEIYGLPEETKVQLLKEGLGFIDRAAKILAAPRGPGSAGGGGLGGVANKWGIKLPGAQ